jgi:hypothetical protein
MKNNLIKKENFVERAQFVHNCKYDYTKVIYKSSSKKVEIGCPKHGTFWQSPTTHLKGHGCPYCKFNRMTREEFMALVFKLYGDKYDYSKCTYTHKNRTSDYITITCKTHGDFNKRIIQHLQGQGCEKCKMEEWKMAKLAEKSLPETNITQESKNDVIKLTYSVKIHYMQVNSQVSIYIWSEASKNRKEAEDILENLKMFLDMTNSVLIEAIVIEMEEPLLDSETTLKIIKCLNLATYEAYLKWWDKTHPTFIPRNLYDHYPNVNHMFNGYDVGFETEVNKAIIIPDHLDRKSA